MKSKLDIKGMTTQHIINRIEWAKRQLVDPYNVVGDHEEFKFTIAHIEEYNEIIEKHIKKLEKELKSRGIIYEENQ